MAGDGMPGSRCRATAAARELSEEPRALTGVEFAEIKRTPSRVFDMLCKTAFPWVARTVAYQICERWNGSGYPRGKSGFQIHPLARIAAVCDVYVLSARRAPIARPTRSIVRSYKLSPTPARPVRRGNNPLFSANDFTLSHRHLCPANNGQIGRVMRTNTEAFDRPSLEIVGEYRCASSHS